MNTYKTYAQIDAIGRLVLEGLPFSAGSLLEILGVNQSHQPEERVESWRALMRHVQALPQSQAITDKEIVAEIEAQRIFVNTIR
jgi:hypothetical protein